MAEHNQNNAESKLVGLVAQFDDPDSLIHACDSAREDGYTKMDAYTPFPVHGIDEALGIRRTLLPFFVLAVGLGACVAGLGLQWYANSTDNWWPFPGYAFRISGKPMFSLPANIPVAFEIIVLSSAFATFFGMWIRNGLPRFANPLHRISRFKRVTDDRFFLMIEARDDRFDDAKVREQFESWGATEIDECREDLTDQKMPAFVKTIGVLLICLAFLPPALVYRARGMTNRLPRFHFMPDMDWQEKYKTQAFGPKVGEEGDERWLFEDKRAMRPAIKGTLARGDLELDDEYYRGYKAGTNPALKANAHTTLTSQATKQDGGSPDASDKTNQDDGGEKKQEAPVTPPEPEWVTRFPSQITVDKELLDWGRNRFDIHCSACHGFSGDGDGLVNQRAIGLNLTGKASWTTAKSLHDPEVIKQPIGRIYDTITNGRATMAPNADRIPTRDRWAIVAYVKALQAQGATREAFQEPVIEQSPDSTSNGTKPSGDGNDKSSNDAGTNNKEDKSNENSN